MYDELTREDIQKMQEELDYRIREIRAELHTKIMEAKEFGDLSENAEYHEARRAKGRNESRITYLQNMIKTAKIVEGNKNLDLVGLNNKVEVLFEDDGTSEIFQLSTTIAQDAINGKISINSPLGKAIRGHKVGDRIFVKVNEQVSYYVIIKSIK